MNRTSTWCNSSRMARPRVLYEGLIEVYEGQDQKAEHGLKSTNGARSTTAGVQAGRATVVVEVYVGAACI